MKALAKLALTLIVLTWLVVVLHRPANVVPVPMPEPPPAVVLVEPVVVAPVVIESLPEPVQLPPTKKPVKKNREVVAPAQKDAPAAKKPSAAPAPVKKQVDMSVLPYSCGTVRYFHDNYTIEHLKEMGRLAGVGELTKAQEAAVEECLHGHK